MAKKKRDKDASSWSHKNDYLMYRKHIITMKKIMKQISIWFRINEPRQQTIESKEKKRLSEEEKIWYYEMLY